MDFVLRLCVRFARYYALTRGRTRFCLRIGANMGPFAVGLAHRREAMLVYASEPNPDAAALLRRSVSHNGLGNRVRVFEVAVSDRAAMKITPAIACRWMWRHLTRMDHARRAAAIRMATCST
jgi:FkbM family methyltransferase